MIVHVLLVIVSAQIPDHVKVFFNNFLCFFVLCLSYLFFKTITHFIDVDECTENPGVCRDRNDICTNIRGSHRCIPINCPYGYMRDPDRKQ